jgi:PAS domain S-box-containing protein
MYLKNTITLLTIFAALILLQIIYYITSQKDYKIVYEEMLVNEAEIYFENIMLKKAQGLDTNRTIENIPTHVKFKLLGEDQQIVKKIQTSKQMHYYYFDKTGEYFYYYNLLNVTQTCIECHNKYKVGSVAGVVKISIPTKEYFHIYKEIQNSKYFYMVLTILFIVLIILLIVVFMKQSRKKHLELERSQRNLEKAEKMAGLGHWRIDNRTLEISFSKNMLKIIGIEDEQTVDLKFILIKVVYFEDKFKLLRAFYKSAKSMNDIQIEFRIINQLDKKKRNVNCHISHIQDAYNEKTIVSIGTIQDITRFIFLRDKLSILERAINQAPISIVVTDENANIEYVNPNFTKVTGYELFDVLGRNPRLLKSEHTKQIEYENLWETITDGRNWSGTFKNITKSGEKFWEAALISPVFSKETNKIIKYIAIKEEITGQINMQQKLKYQEEMMIVQSRHAAMGEMISMIAHQWRQPATVISLCANNILTDVILDEVNQESLKRNSKDIIDQTNYLSRTIDDFRNFFKPNKEKSLVSVEEVMHEVKNMMKATLSNHRIKLQENYSSNKKIKTYKKELEQVLINLIKNSQEILEENNKDRKIIFINEYIKNNNVILHVCDNAGGIEQKNIHRIFEPYFTTKDEKNGTGLGLYISKVIIEKHLLGTIEAFNKDEGACFEITLNWEEE